MLAEIRDEDAAQMPPGLRALAIRNPPTEGGPDTGMIFFGETDRATFGRLLEAVWLDRRMEASPDEQRKLFLLQDQVYLQVGAAEGLERVGKPGPIKGALEGLRDHLGGQLERLAEGEEVTVPTPLGTRRARYLEVELPEPGG